ncbi:PRPF38B [Cordylochernes scorpioides]|uniref:Pre-mRNA-splicing factor 38 n=1 Tax=Cordylochernes scorpioides TaxID=51811 RepID=A0ABY6KXF1_9ARAC|nr:PRPF38B [Cordylochernes scorpioides]
MQMAPGIADKKNNALPMHGNEKTMNLNNLILTNILSSHYFKVNLYQLKTYHEVIDEIYYNVNHLEPWEKGSRKTSGQTGMCGGVRGVGAGGIVSTAFCILYKLFTLKLTRKQLVGLLNHSDSPYIRALGFMYIRYTQPPRDLWDWYEPYMEDTELTPGVGQEVDPKAGGGQTMTMGDLVRHLLTKLDWFSTLFPRIPVPIQKEIERKITEYKAQHPVEIPEEPAPEPTPKDEGEYKRNEDERRPADHHHHRGREEEWTNNQRHNDRSTEDHRHGGDVRKTEDKRPDDHRSKRSNNEDHRRSEDHRRGGDKKSNDHREKRNDDRKNDDYRERRNDEHRRSPERRKRR